MMPCIWQIIISSALEEAAPKCALWLADVVKVRMQLQTLHLASDGTRLVAPNLVWTPDISLTLSRISRHLRNG